MTDVVRQGALQVIRLPGNRATITGPPARVALALDQLGFEGRLAGATNPVPTGDGGVLVTVRLVPDVALVAVVASPAASWWTPRRAAVAGAIAAVVLAVIGTAGFLALSWVAAHWVVILVALAVLAFLGRPVVGRAVQVIVSVTVR